MKKVLYFLLLLQLTTGCLSVSKQQLSAVRQFAVKTGNFSSFPEKIMSELAGIRETRGIYFANSISDPELHLSELKAIVKERLKDDRLPGRVATCFKILNEYAVGLERLSSDGPGKTVSEHYLKFGSELESLVGDYNQSGTANKLPAGIGSALARTLDLGTKHYLANRQLIELKKFTSQADTMVSVICAGMVEFLSSNGLGQLIGAEESGLTESFRFYFTRRQPSVDSEKEFVTLSKRVEEVKLLQKKSIDAAKSLRLAHKKLTEMLNQRISFEDFAVGLNSFFKEIEILDSAIIKMSKE